MTEVHELMSPVDASVSHTQSLHDAAQGMVPGGAMVVLDLSHRPIGLITEDDLTVIAGQDPRGWEKRRCAHLMRPVEGSLSMEHPVEAVLRRYRQGETFPMLVFNADSVVGILYPSAVFQWRHRQQPAGLEAAALPAEERRSPELHLQ